MNYNIILSINTNIFRIFDNFYIYFNFTMFKIVFYDNFVVCFCSVLKLIDVHNLKHLT